MAEAPVSFSTLTFVSIVPFLFYRLGAPAERDPLAGSRVAA